MEDFSFSFLSEYCTNALQSLLCRNWSIVNKSLHCLLNMTEWIPLLNQKLLTSISPIWKTSKPINFFHQKLKYSINLSSEWQIKRWEDQEFMQLMSLEKQWIAGWIKMRIRTQARFIFRILTVRTTFRWDLIITRTLKAMTTLLKDAMRETIYET